MARKPAVSLTRKKGGPVKPQLAAFGFAKEVLPQLEIAMGWLENSGNDAPTIAAINYFGAPSKNIPPRDAVTPTIDAVAGAVRETTIAVAKRVNEQKQVDALLDGLALVIEAELKHQIAELSSPPNAPRTIAQKGFDDPLIGAGSDLGRIYAGATATVRKKSP